MSNRARYECCDHGRRNAVDQHPVLNGIDALEVIDRDLPLDDPLRQRTLLVYCLKPIAAANLTGDNVRITGGERLRDPAVQWADVASAPPPQLAEPGEADTAAVIAALPEPDRVLVVRVANAGDYSRYTLQLTAGALVEAPPTDFDPRLAEIEFTFKAECPSEFDCDATKVCPPEPRTAPDIDYLARDYASYRRLMLDRLSQQVPNWRERNAADAGVALVELLAYVGDHLSYRQDAVATEAYLGTARSRVSLRRHAQLVDYEMHDGCNARTFVFLELADQLASYTLPKIGTRFLTRCDRVPTPIATGSPDEREAMNQRPIAFEPVRDPQASVDADVITIFADHNELHFHTWSDDRCCLPQGATRATLAGAHPDLHAGDCLLFEEVLGPKTGARGDADPMHRQVVRLTRVSPGTDPLPNPPEDVTEIEWSAADALTFPLCLSAKRDEQHGGQPLANVSVARGNLVLADHGLTLDKESLGTVPAPRVLQVAATGSRCDPQSQPQSQREIPARYRPSLSSAPLTHAAAATFTGSANESLRSAVGGATPQIWLRGTLENISAAWDVQRSLLNSDADKREFVVEVDSDQRATLRFGDGRYGRRPAAGTGFDAIYRVGNGTIGNVGADALAHVVGDDVDAIVGVRNPLPAQNGTEPETAESVRRRAPEAFRTQQRAVTPTDYRDVVMQRADVERAATRMRWTGSWHTMFITIDRVGGAPADRPMRTEMAKYLDRYRMAGHDVAFEEPTHVSLRIALHVCVKPEYFRSDVRQVLTELFSSRLLRDGRKGLFHPDNFSFGDPVYLSRLLAAAHAVPGVASVAAREFGRQGDDDPQPLRDGQILLGRREIARLDNDPNFPENGALQLELHGGK